jgi:hypothetical protein
MLDRPEGTTRWSRGKLLGLFTAVELFFAITGIHKTYSRGPHHPWATVAISMPLGLLLIAIVFYVTRPRKG